MYSIQDFLPASRHTDLLCHRIATQEAAVALAGLAIEAMRDGRRLWNDLDLWEHEQEPDLDHAVRVLALVAGADHPPRRWLKRVTRQTEKLVKRLRPAICTVAEALLDKGTLEHEAFYDVLLPALPRSFRPYPDC